MKNFSEIIRIAAQNVAEVKLRCVFERERETERMPGCE
jgi:hypothetical protein